MHTTYEECQQLVLKSLGLALLYFLSGKLGLFLAVPPGYATVVWPPSGIALAALLICGRNLWPGILLGSFILNCHIAGVYPWSDSGMFASPVQVAFMIAVGSTLQALLALAAINRIFGLPLHLHSLRQVGAIFLIAGPILCVTAASIGVATLYLYGLMPADQLWSNWVSWWMGDALGIIVFVPLMLISPLGRNRLVWRGKLVGSLPMIAMLAVLVPLGLTFYAWKITEQNVQRHGQEALNTLAVESEKALLYRLDSYSHALLGGAAFFQGSDMVSRDEWRRYAETVQVRENFPGINGIGWVAPVSRQNLPKFLETIRADGAKDFDVHPETTDRPLNIITYIEPEIINRQAVGLNIGFEDNRLEASNLSRDTGKAAITKRIVLVQDSERLAGFLLLHPMYYPDLPVHTVEQRRHAFRGWIYAPFIAKRFLEDLTGAQGERFHITVYDGTEVDENKLIYTSKRTVHAKQRSPHYSVRKVLDIKQQKWLVVWSSMPEFEQQIGGRQSAYVLFIGLFITVLMAAYLILTNVHNVHTMRWLTEEHRFVMPVGVFLLASLLVFTFYSTLDRYERNNIQNLVREEARQINQLVTAQTSERMLALERLADRWSVSEGTPYEQWRADARNYVKDIRGLRAVEWIDADMKIRWAVPEEENKMVIGMTVGDNKGQQLILEKDKPRSLLSLTAPFDLVQGYRAFIAYAPLTKNDEPDGYIAGIFHMQDFVKGLLPKELSGHYALQLSSEGKEFFRNGYEQSEVIEEFTISSNLRVYDRDWTLTLTPLKSFTESQRTNLPLVVLLGGLLFSALLGLTTRTFLLARIRARHLEASEETFRTAMESASIGMAWVGHDGRWLRVNKALCSLLGYPAEELMQTDFQSITHPDDLEIDLDYVLRMLEGEIETYQLEKRYFHKSGRVIWALLSVSLVWNDKGEPDYFIAQIQDITERKEMERMKSEFISVVSHELRTPLTSIRGSLGLILGVMVKDLPEKVKELITIAHNNSERLILLINDILDIDKIASGQMRFDMKPESVAAVTREAVNANQAYAAKYNNRIEVNDIPEDVHIRVDAARFIQALSNLLSNACKYSPKDVPVQVRYNLRGSTVRICVEDKGSGIPEEFRDRIFGKFMQADSAVTRKAGGTGLGLNITKQIVEHMHGEIGFETETGKGTTFWVEFPLVQIDTEDADTIIFFREEESGVPRILHVEDDADLSNVLATALHGAAEVLTAYNLKEARRLLREQAYTLVVLDIGLPDGSGLELLKSIKAVEGQPLPVVILSADAPDETVRQRVADVMVKSRVSERRIVERITELIRKQKGE
jgi:PAS domain S-box-containing protein